MSLSPIPKRGKSMYSFFKLFQFDVDMKDSARIYGGDIVVPSCKLTNSPLFFEASWRRQRANSSSRGSFNSTHSPRLELVLERYKVLARWRGIPGWWFSSTSNVFQAECLLDRFRESSYLCQKLRIYIHQATEKIDKNQHKMLVFCCQIFRKGSNLETFTACESSSRQERNSASGEPWATWQNLAIFSCSHLCCGSFDGNHHEKWTNLNGNSEWMNGFMLWCLIHFRCEFAVSNLEPPTVHWCGGEQFWISENIDVIDWSLRNMSFMTIITKPKKVSAYSCCIIAWLTNGSWEIDVIWTRPPGKLEESPGTFWGVGIPKVRTYDLGYGHLHRS